MSSTFIRVQGTSSIVVVSTSVAFLEPRDRLRSRRDLVGFAVHHLFALGVLVRGLEAGHRLDRLDEFWRSAGVWSPAASIARLMTKKVSQVDMSA